MELKTTLIKAVQDAGDLVADRFRTVFSVYHKSGANNLVTEIDQASEQLIRKIINEAFPDHGIIGEEYEAQQTRTQYRWIVDPIDGTTNFARGIPLCCVSIGLMKDEELLMGAVYNPMLHELFFAEKGQGAFLNDQQIRVSKNSDLNAACLVTGFPYHFPEGKNITGIFSKLVARGIPVRRLGSAAMDLCWVACGRFDGFWEFNLQPWDIAAGYLILQEAGGRITDFNGSPYTVWDKETLATNGTGLHEALRQEIIS
jgi:myo-inositol-1(or 4)-monophosphatase